MGRAVCCAAAIAALAWTAAAAEGGPATAACSAANVASVVHGFMAALSSGNARAAADSFAPENGIVDNAADARDDGELGFQWYSVGDRAGLRVRGDATDRASLPLYFADRVTHHERLRLLMLQAGASWTPKAAGFEVVAVRTADDLPRRPGYLRLVFGKGEVNCVSRTIATLSFGRSLMTRTIHGAPSPPPRFRWPCPTPPGWRGKPVVCATSP